MSIDNPEILDFFDIFNNKILENMTIVIHRQILRRLNGLVISLDDLISQINRCSDNKKGLTVTFKNFIDKALKNTHLINDGLITTKGSENNSLNYFIGLTNPINNKQDLNYNSPLNNIQNSAPGKDVKNTMFSVSKKVHAPYFMDDEDDGIHMSESSDDSFSHDENNSKNNFTVNSNILKEKKEKIIQENYNNKIVVNNVNNINNYNIINGNVKDLEKLNNITKFNNNSLINNKTNLKFNPGLPPVYNITNISKGENIFKNELGKNFLDIKYNLFRFFKQEIIKRLYTFIY